MNNHIWLYPVGVIQIVVGVLGLGFGWMTTDSAVTLIITGTTTIGITRQNVAVGRATGAIK